MFTPFQNQSVETFKCLHVRYQDWLCRTAMFLFWQFFLKIISIYVITTVVPKASTLHAKKNSFPALFLSVHLHQEFFPLYWSQYWSPAILLFIKFDLLQQNKQNHQTQQAAQIRVSQPISAEFFVVVINLIARCSVQQNGAIVKREKNTTFSWEKWRMLCNCH